MNLKSQIYKDIEICFRDIDALGHVNNARYLGFMEDIRIQYLYQMFPDLGFQKNFKKFPFVLGDVYCRFISPVFLGEHIRIATAVTSIGTKSFIMEYEIQELKSQRLVATGKTTMVMFDIKTQSSYPVPQDFIERVEKIQGHAIPKK